MLILRVRSYNFEFLQNEHPIVSEKPWQTRLEFSSVQIFISKCFTFHVGLSELGLLHNAQGPVTFDLIYVCNGRFTSKLISFAAVVGSDELHFVFLWTVASGCPFARFELH